MSLESANAPPTTITTMVVESNAAANNTVVDGIETVMDTSHDTAKTTPPMQKDRQEIVTTTTTITLSDADVDIEAGKLKSIQNENENEVGAKETETISNNTLNDTAAEAKAPAVVVANGENNGDVITTKKITTITSSILLPMKQQHQDQPMDSASTPSGSNTTHHSGKMENDAGLINFKVLYVVTQLCGITMIILVGSYIGVHAGGFGGTSQPSLEFNWHPFLMTIGLIFLYGNSILIYRGFRTTRKKTLKITHAAIHMGAFILTVIALQTVFDSHNLAAKPIPNMYSLHSWLGLSAVLIFSMQYVAGFMAYMVPGLKEQYKIAYMPLHIYFGLFGFGLAIASALMGLTEKAIFSITNYSGLPSAGVMVNMCGVLFVIFGALVLYLATEPSYKRRPLPEDAVLLTGVNE